MIHSNTVAQIATYVISAYTCNCIAHNVSGELQRALYTDKYNYVRKAIELCNHTHSNVQYYMNRTENCTYFVFNLHGKGVQMSFHQSGKEYKGAGHTEITYNHSYGSCSKRALQRAFHIKPECSQYCKDMLSLDNYYIYGDHDAAIESLIKQLLD